MKSLGNPRKWPGLDGFGLNITEYINTES